MLVLSRQRDETIIIGRGQSDDEHPLISQLRKEIQNGNSDLDGLLIKIDKLIQPGLVRVTVVDIRGDKVRIGIEAAAEIPVHRLEVFQAIERENARAVQKSAE